MKIRVFWKAPLPNTKAHLIKILPHAKRAWKYTTRHYDIRKQCASIEDMCPKDRLSLEIKFIREFRSASVGRSVGRQGKCRSGEKSRLHSWKAGHKKSTLWYLAVEVIIGWDSLGLNISFRHCMNQGMESVETFFIRGTKRRSRPQPRKHVTFERSRGKKCIGNAESFSSK